MDGRGVGAMHRLGGVVALDPLLDEARRGLGRRRPERPERAAVVLGDERPMGRVQRDHPDRPAAVDDDPGGFRVQPDVELGRGGRVPVVVGAAHDDDLGDPLQDPRLLLDRGGDVRQRPDRDQRDVAIGGEERLDQPVDAVAGLNARRRRPAAGPGGRRGSGRRGSAGSSASGRAAGSSPRGRGSRGSPIQSKTRRVFSVQLWTAVLPLTVVAPTSSSSGERAATMSATASSVPVSTSRMTFVGMALSLPDRSSCVWRDRGPCAR